MGIGGGEIQEGGDIGRVHHVRNAGLDKAQAGIKFARRNINNLRYADDTILMVKRRRPKEPFDESERGE